MPRKKLLTVTSPLTTKEKKRFEEIQKYAAAGGDFALIRTALDGKPCAVMCWMQGMEDDFTFYPVAMLLLDEDFDRLTDPTEDVEGK